MDGLEDRAAASLDNLVEQLYTNEVVEVKLSSRDIVILRITEEIKASAVSANGQQRRIVTKTLVLRGGLSMQGLRMLHEALPLSTSLEALEVFNLHNSEEIRAAVDCCRVQPRIRTLALKRFSSPTSRRTGEGRVVLATTIRDAVFGSAAYDDDEDRPQQQQQQHHDGIPTLETLELSNYPIGAQAVHILTEAMARNETLKTFRLMDCDLRSDSAKAVATMIKHNTTLETLDLSYNPFYLGSEITRELTIKTLIQRGLRHNFTLKDMKMDQAWLPKTFNRRKLDRQLEANKFRRDFVRDGHDPFALPATLWPKILSRVSVKPTILNQFVQECAVALFA